jgi:hypothetical protein
MRREDEQEWWKKNTALQRANHGWFGWFIPVVPTWSIGHL